MATLAVKNEPDTTGEVCGPCGSWVEHWKKFNGSLPPACPSCGQTPTRDNPWHGAHVRVIEKPEWGVVIVPVCKLCNETPDDQPYFVKGVMPASATPCDPPKSAED